MKKEVATQLYRFATEVAERFSHNDRPLNTNNEKFDVEKIIPLSEHTAVIIYIKNTGKRAIAFFYYINMNGGEWKYFFPTDSHILGMEQVGKIKIEIEGKNWEYNL